jgi:hypothetical protein
MMKRVASEVRKPGMTRIRKCRCGAPLALDDGDCCSECRPHLSARAQAVSNARKQSWKELKQAESGVANLEFLLKRLGHKVEGKP